MYYKIFFNIILILLVAIFQISFVNNLPLYFNQINIFLLILIFILSLTNFEYIAWWSIGIGLILDIFSFYFFGVYLVSYFLTILLINYLYKNYFTDRSLYSFSILIVISIIFYEFIIKTFYYLLFLINSKEVFFLVSEIFWFNLFSELIINLLAMSILFYIFSLLSEKLKPVFLIKK